MAALEETPVLDAAELQRVLTRYVDSFDGYTQVAEVAESPFLKEAFLEIATRRKVIVGHVAGLIFKQGEKADESGSAEALIHRCWIRVRAQMSSEELRILLEECVRGEKELIRVAEAALLHGNLEPEHAAVIADVASEVREAISTFESALNR